MNNSRLIIVLVVIFLVGVTGIYWIYQSQVGSNSNDLLPVPSPVSESEITSTLEASPSIAPSIAERNGSVPASQPNSGLGSGNIPPQFPPLQ